MHLRTTQSRLLCVYITSHTDLNSIGVQMHPKYQVQKELLPISLSCLFCSCSYSSVPLFLLFVSLCFEAYAAVNGTSVISSAGRDYAIRGTLSMSELRLPALNHQWGKSSCCRGKTWKTSTFCSSGCIMTPLAIAIQGWTPETSAVD